MAATEDQAVFGYGSLIETRSRRVTVPAAKEARPVIVNGLERLWNYKSPGPPGISYVGTRFQEGMKCNGVVFPVAEADLPALDEREVGYIRKKLAPQQIEWLSGDTPRYGTIWVYTIDGGHEPSMDFPILQSYVDVCLQGCLDLEEEFPAARGSGFARRFVDWTRHWSRFWMADRGSPVRPRPVPTRKREIDSLLADSLGHLLPENLLGND